jgi:multidrug efflux pump subunit AcrA (membrane-fusion protein)
MKKMKIQRLFILLVVSGLLLAACGGGKTPTPSATESTTPVAPVNLVVSEGQLLPNQFINVSFNATGNVAEVLAVEGSDVKAGDVLARLENSEALRSAVEASKTELLLAQQALDNLNKNALLSKSQFELALAQADKELDDAKDDYEALNYPRGTPEKIHEAELDYELAEEELDDAQAEFDAVKWLTFDEPERVEAYNALVNARTRRDAARDTLKWLRDKPDAIEIADKTARYELAKAKYDQAKKDLESLKGGIDPDQLDAAESRVNQAKAALAAAEAALADLSLTAPIDGTVVKIDLKVGENVPLGKVAAIMADYSRWTVETTDLTEIDIVKVKEGQKVKVVLDAIPDLTLDGVVESIANVYEEKQGDITYKVTIAIEDKDPRMRWGMTAQVSFEEE